uniref:Uncharacterized protein n=1 Tax=Glossina pallidipes TaxID=7398 RepID=A0A1A9ZZV2_GLOPL
MKTGFCKMTATRHLLYLLSFAAITLSKACLAYNLHNMYITHGHQHNDIIDVIGSDEMTSSNYKSSIVSLIVAAILSNLLNIGFCVGVESKRCISNKKSSLTFNFE